MSNPEIRLNCWTCGRLLRYVLTRPDGSHVYACATHGWFRLTPTGLAPDTSDVEH